MISINKYLEEGVWDWIKRNKGKLALGAAGLAGLGMYNPNSMVSPATNPPAKTPDPSADIPNDNLPGAELAKVKKAIQKRMRTTDISKEQSQAPALKPERGPSAPVVKEPMLVKKPATGVNQKPADLDNKLQKQRRGTITQRGNTRTLTSDEMDTMEKGSDGDAFKLIKNNGSINFKQNRNSKSLSPHWEW